MSTCNKRTARRFQLEALETRWTPGGASGGVLVGRMASHIGEEIPQVHVAHIGEEIPQVRVAPLGGRGGIGGDLRFIPLGGRVGGTGDFRFGP